MICVPATENQMTGKIYHRDDIFYVLENMSCIFRNLGNMSRISQSRRHTMALGGDIREKIICVPAAQMAGKTCHRPWDRRHMLSPMHSVSKVEKTVFSWGISYFFG